MRANRIISFMAVVFVSVIVLGRLGTADTSLTPGSTPSVATKPQLIDEFPELTPALVKSLTEVLGDSITNEGYTYARMLNRLGPAAIKPLLEMLASEEKPVRLRALNTLFYIANENDHIREAIPALTQILQEKDPDLHVLALMILNEILAKDAFNSKATKLKLPVQGEPLIRGQLVNLTFTRPDGSKATVGSSEGLDDDLIQMGATLSVYPDYLLIEARGLPGHVVVERYRELHEVILMK